jgi:hypothetical protein
MDKQQYTWVPTAAVTAVAFVAVTAALVVAHDQLGRESARQSSQVAATSSAPQEVVRAPPLVVKAPPIARDRKGTNAMGAGPACVNCGVVKTVVANHAGPSARDASYLMEIRMDDGTLRTIEHRGALPAGSRVIVEGQSIKLARN